MRFTLNHAARIVWHVGWSDFLLKYRGSVLGYLWSLLAPLAKFLVIFYVFRPFIGNRIAQYPLYLFLGIIAWEHFTVTTTHCMTTLHEKAAFIQKMPFPRVLLILIVGWSDLLVFLSYFLIFALFAVLRGQVIDWNWLYLPVVLVHMTFLALGVGSLLSAYSLKYRDILHLWGIASQVLFWLTPITYAYRLETPILTALAGLPSMLSPFHPIALFDVFVQFQPLSIIIYDLRRVTFYAESGGVPSAAHALGLTLILGSIFCFGLWVFHKRSKYFVEEY